LFVASATSAQIAGERPVSTPVYAPKTLFGSSAIASDGNQFLAAWIDGRDRYSVFVARIDRDGTVLDPMGIFIATAVTNTPVGVAWRLGRVTQRAIESLSPLAVVNDRSEPDASLIVTGPGRVAVAYTRIGWEPEYGDVERAFVATPHALRGRAASR
jgi:hypothetical protein